MDNASSIFNGKVMGMEGSEMNPVEEQTVGQVYQVAETAEQEANRKIGLSSGTPKNGYELTGMGGGPSMNAAELTGLGSGGAMKNMNDFIGLGSGSSKKMNVNDMLGLRSSKKVNMNDMLGFGSSKKGKMKDMLGGGKMKGSFNASSFLNMGKQKNVNATEMLGGYDKKISTMMGMGKQKAMNTDSKLSNFLGRGGFKNDFFENPTRNMKQVITNNFGFWNNAKKAMIKNPVQIGMKRVKQQKNISMFGDVDKDGVANILDCQPLNFFRQGPENNFIDDEIKNREDLDEINEKIRKRKEQLENVKGFQQAFNDNIDFSAVDLEKLHTSAAKEALKSDIESDKTSQASDRALRGELTRQTARQSMLADDVTELEKAKYASNIRALKSQEVELDAMDERERSKQIEQGVMDASNIQRRLMQEEIVQEQEERFIPTLAGLKKRLAVKQQLKDRAKSASYSDLYRLEQEYKLKRKYADTLDDGTSETRKVWNPKTKKYDIVTTGGKGRSGTRASTTSRAVGAVSAGFGALGGGGAMGGAEAASYKMAALTGGMSGGGFGMMLGGVGSGSGFGVMAGQQPSGYGMSQMIGGPSTGRGFAAMAGIKAEEAPVMTPPQPAPEPMPQQYAPQERVGPAPSAEGKVWSPYSKKYVSYTRGSYDKEDEQRRQMAPMPQQY